MKWNLLLFALATTISAQAPAPGEFKALKDEALGKTAGEVIVLAELMELRPSPGVWPGIVKTYQAGRWKLKEVWRGKILDNELEVQHLLVGELVAKEAPYLRPELLYRGARAVLRLDRGPWLDNRLAWFTTDEKDGCQLLDPPRKIAEPIPELCALVLSHSDLSTYFHLRAKNRRSPLFVVFTEALPQPIALRVGDEALEFRPKELAKGQRTIAFEEIHVDGERARVRLQIPSEGVSACFHCARREGSFVVLKADVRER